MNSFQRICRSPAFLVLALILCAAVIAGGVALAPAAPPASRTARFLPCTSSCPFQLLTITEMRFCTVFSNVFLLQYFSKKRSLYVIFIYLFVSLKRRGTCLSFKFRSKCVIFLAI